MEGAAQTASEAPAAAAPHPVRLLSYESCGQPFCTAHFYHYIVLCYMLCYTPAVLEDILCDNDGGAIELVPLYATAHDGELMGACVSWCGCLPALSEGVWVR